MPLFESQKGDYFESTKRKELGDVRDEMRRKSDARAQRKRKRDREREEDMCDFTRCCSTRFALAFISGLAMTVMCVGTFLMSAVSTLACPLDKRFTTNNENDCACNISNDEASVWASLALVAGVCIGVGLMTRLIARMNNWHESDNSCSEVLFFQVPLFFFSLGFVMAAIMSILMIRSECVADNHTIELTGAAYLSFILGVVVLTSGGVYYYKKTRAEIRRYGPDRSVLDRV